MRGQKQGALATEVAVGIAVRLQRMLAFNQSKMLTHASWADNYLCHEISDKKDLLASGGKPWPD
jgi:hypothetical protein